MYVISKFSLFSLLLLCVFTTVQSDKSIWKLADQFKEEPKAVKLANVYLKTLKLDDSFCSYDDHFKAASSFWCQLSVIMKFNEAMKKDPKLVKVLTKYSKGAETLRRHERMIHIRKDFHLELQAIDSNDSHSKMRLALNILFGYWVDRDVTQLFMSLQNVTKKIGKAVYLSEDAENAAFHCCASSATDVEIGKYQEDKGKEVEKRGYVDGPLCIQLVLNKSSILTFSKLVWLLQLYQPIQRATG